MKIVSDFNNLLKKPMVAVAMMPVGAHTITYAIILELRNIQSAIVAVVTLEGRQNALQRVGQLMFDS